MIDKIRVLIVGAGDAGKLVATELLNSSKINYLPVGFIDDDTNKASFVFSDIKVLGTTQDIKTIVSEYSIQEIFICIPSASKEAVKRIYDICSLTQCKIKIIPGIYQFINGEVLTTKLREVDILDLLGRNPIEVIDEKTKDYYKDKVILITGGGGSIGSELCRQLAKMEPKQLIVLDIYENCAYDLEQELKMQYGKTIDLRLEILSVTNRESLEQVFACYKPDIVIHAAAHKHVPLMEHNCVEAVENNIFGTLNVVELSEKYNVEHFLMVSTDKAVNPTNVMGATKRMCEMIVECHSATSKTIFTATRFGNVLGSAGSVIPLFKKQIANGGPITLTDKRIIRYFMTIPEASQLVLESGRMAKNGELFVLDMGEPVKIYDLAVNMIKLSGLELNKNIEIIETGLRPGEKLYEELLVKTEELDKTENDLIFIEKDKPISYKELKVKLNILYKACKSKDNDKVRDALHKVVDTYKKQ